MVGKPQDHVRQGHKPMDRAANGSRVTEHISTLSTTLTNIDVGYAFELARIRVTARPYPAAMIMDTLRQRHVERRTPYVWQSG